MPDYIGPALRGLSQTIQTGFSDIGKQRLSEAELALKGAELGHKIRTYQEEAPIRALKLTEAVNKTKEAERLNQPWNVPSWVGESLGAMAGQSANPTPKIDSKIWAAQTVPRIASVFGDDAKYDPSKGQIVRRSTGQPVTVADFEKAQDAISGMIGLHTDGDKFLEMAAKTGDPAVLQKIAERDADPVGYLRYQLDQKVAMLNQLQSLGLGDKAMKQAWEGVKYTREKLDKLLAEQRVEEKEEGRFQRGLKADLAKEGRTEQREEGRFERGKSWDIKKMGLQDQRDIAKEDRAEKRQAWEEPKVAMGEDGIPKGTVYQENAKGELKILQKATDDKKWGKPIQIVADDDIYPKGTIYQIGPKDEHKIVYKPQEKQDVAIIREYEAVTGKKYNPETDRVGYEKYLEKKKEGTGIQFTPDAIAAMGKRYGQTGELPPMGMGKKAAEARMQIINQWASDLQSKGETPEENAARQSAFKASRNELNQLQAQRGKVLAFARTAEKNLALAGELSEKVDRTGIPVVNRWINAGRRAITGDVDLARFDAALRTAVNEYAKVTSSATGGAVTSDTARKEVEDMLKAAMTPEQVRGVIQLLVENELPNRIAGYDEQIDVIKDALANRTPEPIPGKPMGGGKPRFEILEVK